LKNAKIALASVFLTFFIDTLCWSIVFPIFAPYFLDSNNALFDANISMSTRTIVLGLFLMAFSLGQFLGAPIIGEYADRHGRKKALALSIFFTLLGLALTAWSMGNYCLFWLFVGRLMTGIFASNTAICLASITDLSEDKQIKAKNFGYFSALAGISFVTGALIGGILSDSTINPSFYPGLPIWLACGLTLINLLFVLIAFKETIRKESAEKFQLFTCFQNIKLALKTKQIKTIYTIYFLFLFAWTILLQFIPVVVVKNFGFTESNIGELALFVGICWTIGSGYLNQWLRFRFSTSHILRACFLIFTILSACVVLPQHIYNILLLTGLCVGIGGAIWPLCTNIISNLGTLETQGKVLGMSQSVQSLAMAIAPLVGGIAFKISLELPFFLGSAACLAAGIIYWKK